MIKQNKPCGHFFGNVCAGFGGTTECDNCGWDKYHHDPWKTRAEEFAKRMLGPKPIRWRADDQD